jgi:hypothetical protein
MKPESLKKTLLNETDNEMKKFLVAFPVALLLSACAGASTSVVTVTEQKTVPAPAVTVTESVAPAPNNGGKYAPDMFLDYVHGMLPETFSTSNDGLLDFGDSTCAAISAGVPIIDLINIGLDNGLTSDQISTLIAASVMFLCPENEPFVQTQIGD